MLDPLRILLGCLSLLLVSCGGPASPTPVLTTMTLDSVAGAVAGERSFTGACPHTVIFSASIAATINQPGSYPVSYVWELRWEERLAVGAHQKGMMT